MDLSISETAAALGGALNNLSTAERRQAEIERLQPEPGAKKDLPPIPASGNSSGNSGGGVVVIPGVVGSGSGNLGGVVGSGSSDNNGGGIAIDAGGNGGDSAARYAQLFQTQVEENFVAAEYRSDSTKENTKNETLVAADEMLAASAQKTSGFASTLASYMSR